MLKVLALLILTFYVFPMQGYAQPHKTQQTPKNAEPPSPVTPVVPQQSEAPTLQTEGDKNVKADVRIVSSPGKDGYDKALFWVNLALVGVGIGGIAVAAKTLKKIERQTKAGEDAAKAAKDGAEAALLNARAIINAERPWLVVKITQDEKGTYTFSAVNLGRTPAVVTTTYLRVITLEEMKELPVPPKYTAPRSREGDPQLIPTGESHYLHHFNWEEARKYENSRGGFRAQEDASYFREDRLHRSYRSVFGETCHPRNLLVSLVYWRREP